jgi:hypothetical protein
MYGTGWIATFLFYRKEMSSAHYAKGKERNARWIATLRFNAKAFGASSI